ncbi:MAG: response regulator [Blastocatellia bacterium]|nr:response regulator [Blastocatellia bacterium]
MESEWNGREFSSEEIQTLAIGQFNLKNHDLGFAYLQEALRNDPNNVILAGQVNALQIRLEEIRRHNEDVAALPKGRTILVVDDSATVRKLISNKLEKSGHVVACAEDGVEAMEWIENNKPDLVLLDIAMPRMDGYQVCKLIRSNEATKDVPVVMISGKDGFFDKVRGRMAGTSGYITKPFGPETLMRALDTYLVHEPQAEAAPEPVAA